MFDGRLVFDTAVDSEGLEQGASGLANIAQTAIGNILANHGISGTATLSVDKDGYFYFSYYGTDLEFKSIGTGMTKYISLNITEEF